jgi:hypothetical protein
VGRQVRDVVRFDGESAPKRQPTYWPTFGLSRYQFLRATVLLAIIFVIALLLHWRDSARDVNGLAAVSTPIAQKPE